MVGMVSLGIPSRFNTPPFLRLLRNKIHSVSALSMGKLFDVTNSAMSHLDPSLTSGIVRGVLWADPHASDHLLKHVNATAHISHSNETSVSMLKLASD